MHNLARSQLGQDGSMWDSYLGQWRDPNVSLLRCNGVLEHSVWEPLLTGLSGTREVLWAWWDLLFPLWYVV